MTKGANFAKKRKSLNKTIPVPSPTRLVSVALAKSIETSLKVVDDFMTNAFHRLCKFIINSMFEEWG